MRTTFLLPALGALALASCGGGTEADADGDGEVTAEEAQELVERSGDKIKPLPGKYRASMKVVRTDIPGAPPEMAKMMSSAMEQTMEHCVTPEMAAQGFGEAMKDSQNENCTIGRFSIEGNDMDMAMTCQEPGAGTVEITMTGTVAPTESDMTMVTKGTFGEMGPGEFEMNMTQKRIGDCDS